MPGASAHTVRFTHARARMVGPRGLPTLQPAPVPRARPATRPATARPARPAAGKPARLLDWMTAHRAMTFAIGAMVLVASVGVAAVVFGQSFTATPTTRTSPVAFASGDDVASLDALDFVDAPTIGASGATAAITVYGIPGATSLSLGEVLELVNADTADNQAYAVTLSVSGTPAASLTAFTITFSDDVSGTPTTRTWNLLTTPTLTTYTLSDAETWELNISSLVMTTAASGSQGTLTISASMTPV